MIRHTIRMQINFKKKGLKNSLELLCTELVQQAQQTISTCNAALLRNNLHENVDRITWPLAL